MRAFSKPSADFPETRLTLLRRVAIGADADRAQAAEEFWLRYREPLLTHLIFRFRMRRAVAEDALHDFYYRKFAPKGRPCLISHFEARNGSRFRNFLMKSLERFIIDEFRRLHGPRYGSDPPLALTANSGRSAAHTVPSPSEIFDYAWASGLLSRAVNLMHDRASQSGTFLLWEVFCLRYLEPAESGCRPVKLRECVARFGLGGTTSAFRVCEQARTLFRECLFEILAEYADGAEGIKEELTDLIASLSGADFGLPEEPK